MKRIYIAVPVNTVLPDAKDRLVNCGNPAQARQHVTKNIYDVRVATQHEIAKAVGDGIKVEEVGDGQTGTLPGTGS